MTLIIRTPKDYFVIGSRRSAWHFVKEAKRQCKKFYCKILL